MAKISARGAFKVVGYVYDVTDSGQRARGERMEMTYALRSDGKVLRKVDFIYPAGPYDGGRTRRNAGGYSIHGTLRDAKTLTPDARRAAFESWRVNKIDTRWGEPIRKARI
jgi:hypothetical protein